MALNGLAVGALAAVAVGAAAYALAYPWLTGGQRAEQRQKALVGDGRGNQQANRAAAASANQRREKIAQSLKEVEAKQKAATKMTFEKRVAQAGLDWDKRKFLVISAVIGFVFAAFAFAASGDPFAALAGLFIGGFGVPRWLLGYLRKRRIKKFIDELPNAMDIIVRGIRSGLPLGDCLRIIANESAEPVKGEFRTIVENQAMGLPMAEAVGKLYERVPVPEANFFGIVIAIQSKSGGNLSEVLANLSRVIRERKKMRGKISAMSMEAKASAAIIGSLPIIVGALVYASSPAYIELLWTTIHGRIWMAIGGFMMLCGVLVMRKMISFDI
jgi:tight adherence protein B